MGKGNLVNDADAANGKAYQVQANGDNELNSWVYTTSYIRDLPSQVYFHLKLSNLNAPHLRIRLQVNAAEVNTGLNLTAADFRAAGVYQEFPVSFTQRTDFSKPFLAFQVGLTDPDNITNLNIDRMDIYTAPEPFSSNKSWAVPGANYRGSSLKVRYTNSPNSNNQMGYAPAQLVGPFLPSLYNPKIALPPPVLTNASDPAFAQLWGHTDAAVAGGLVARSWIWGSQPRGFASVLENYDGKQRLVQYHDKARMEVNNPNADRSNPFFVSNGLLVREMISGQQQVGDNSFMVKPPANVAIAGDPVNPNAPTYASFRNLASLNNDRRAANRGNQSVTTALNRDGSTRELASLPADVKLVYYDEHLGHNIPDVFWNFMNSRGLVLTNGSYQQDTVVNWVYAMGYPLSEPYWTKTLVGGVEREVLVQVFERRVLSYTPANPASFQVEMGNVGQHYYAWRYGEAPDSKNQNNYQKIQ